MLYARVFARAACVALLCGPRSLAQDSGHPLAEGIRETIASQHELFDELALVFAVETRGFSFEASDPVEKRTNYKVTWGKSGSSRYWDFSNALAGTQSYSWFDGEAWHRTSRGNLLGAYADYGLPMSNAYPEKYFDLISGFSIAQLVEKSTQVEMLAEGASLRLTGDQLGTDESRFAIELARDYAWRPKHCVITSGHKNGEREYSLERIERAENGAVVPAEFWLRGYEVDDAGARKPKSVTEYHFELERIVSDPDEVAALMQPGHPVGMQVNNQYADARYVAAANEREAFEAWMRWNGRPDLVGVPTGPRHRAEIPLTNLSAWARGNCGPVALCALLTHSGLASDWPKIVDGSGVDEAGLSMTELARVAAEEGLDLVPIEGLDVLPNEPHAMILVMQDPDAKQSHYVAALPHCEDGDAVTSWTLVDFPRELQFLEPGAELHYWTGAALAVDGPGLRAWIQRSDDVGWPVMSVLGALLALAAASMFVWRMRRARVAPSGAVALFLIACLTSCGANDVESNATESLLDFVNETIDCGSHDVPSTVKPKASVVNRSGADLTVRAVTTSCTCATAITPGSVIPSGGTLEVPLSWEISSSGPHLIRVWVRASTEEEPKKFHVAQLLLSAYGKGLVTVEPGRLVLRGANTERQPRVVTVRHFVEGDEIPLDLFEVGCDLPGVEVKSSETREERDPDGRLLAVADVEVFTNDNFEAGAQGALALELVHPETRTIRVPLSCVQ
ncbi:MAG: DUF1573 domain-containing protein [bacterium]|nr:DUF1573 domain-containing protein [bacterium]